MRPRALNLTGKVVATSICVACFLALSWEQLMAYLQSSKGLSQQLVKVGNRKLPIVAFCLKDAYLSKTTNIMREEDYLDNIKNFSVTLKGRALNDYEYVPIEDFEVSGYLSIVHQFILIHTLQVWTKAVVVSK